MNVIKTLKSDIEMAKDYIFVKEDQSYILVVIANVAPWLLMIPLSLPEKLSGLYIKIFIFALFEIMYVAVYPTLNKSSDKSTVSIVRLAMTAVMVIIIFYAIRILMFAA